MTVQKSLFRIYCIDASALINLTRYPGYPREIFPTIWEKLENMIKRNEFISHIEVYKEIAKGGDLLFRWCKDHKKMFKDVEDCQIEEFRKIKPRYDPHYWNNQIDRDKPWADPWLIALSICKDAIIVTDEKNIQNRIPYIANHFNIPCLNLINFFKEIGIKY